MKKTDARHALATLDKSAPATSYREARRRRETADWLRRQARPKPRRMTPAEVEKLPF